MKKFILLFFVGLVSMTSFAHQPDASTMMLVEKDNGTWFLQISSSLTAFQQEVRTHFSETPYKTPEEFQQMVLEHLKNNLHIRFNDQDVSFAKGVVKLGHETSVVFEVFGIPTAINSVLVENNAFKDIHRNKSTLILLKEGFKKDHFTLNTDNNHTLNLYVEGNAFKIVEHDESSNDASLFGWIVIGGLLLLIAFMAISNMFKPEKFELRPTR